jgi:hypothetical protein
LIPELRYRDETGQIKIELPAQSEKAAKAPAKTKNGDYGDFRGRQAVQGMDEYEEDRQFELKKIYAYGVGQNRLRQAARTLQLPVTIVDNLEEADVVMTLKSYYRKRPQPITESERMGKPVYVLRSNTVVQMESCLADIFALNGTEIDPLAIVRRETQEAIRKVISGARNVELTPQNASVRRQQHEMARAAKLISHSLGREPNRRVRIYHDSARGKS